MAPGPNLLPKVAQDGALREPIRFCAALFTIFPLIHVKFQLSAV